MSNHDRSNHDRLNHDRPIMSENPGVYIAMKSAVTLTETETFTVLCLEGDSWPVVYAAGPCFWWAER